MANDLVDGYIYLIESDATDNQNWVPTVANIDLATNYAGQEGVEYCKLKIPMSYRKKFSTGAQVVTGSGGNEFDRRSARRAYILLAEGIETSVANGDLVEQFIMSNRHTSGIEGTFKRYYLIFKFSSTVYVQFTDSGGTRRDYCKGIILDGEIIWNEKKSLVVTVRLNWRSVW